MTSKDASNSLHHLCISLFEGTSKQPLACFHGPGFQQKQFWVQQPQHDVLSVRQTDNRAWLQAVVATCMVAAKTQRHKDKITHEARRSGHGFVWNGHCCACSRHDAPAFSFVKRLCLSRFDIHTCSKLSVQALLLVFSFLAFLCFESLTWLYYRFCCMSLCFLIIQAVYCTSDVERMLYHMAYVKKVSCDELLHMPINWQHLTNTVNGSEMQNHPLCCPCTAIVKSANVESAQNIISPMRSGTWLISQTTVKQTVD